MRRSGNSYLQISRELTIPKSTLSGWFSKLEWSKSVVSKNSKLNSFQIKRRLYLANSARTKYRIARKSSYIKQAAIDYQLYKNDSLFIAGINLYWGEGEKTSSGRVSVINTDPEMLKVVVSFYRKFLHVDNSDLRIGLFLYEEHKESEVKEFRSNLLNIPINQFIKTQVLKSRSKLTSRKSKYGICSLYFSSTEQGDKIREWIRLFQKSLHLNIKRD